MHCRPTLARFAIVVCCVLALAFTAFAAPRPAPAGPGRLSAQALRSAPPRAQAFVPGATARPYGSSRAARTAALASAPADYKITYKNCSLSVGTSATVTVTNAGAATIKIQRLKSAPANPVPVPGKVAYLLNSTGISTLSVDGDVKTFSSAAYVGFLHVTGRLNSVTAAGAVIATIQADLVGTVKQQANARSESAGEVFTTAIYSGDLASQGTLRPHAPFVKVTLTGVSLFETIASEQTAWLSLATKKWRNPFGQNDVSRAEVTFGADNVIRVGDLWQVKTTGGGIMPAAIVAAAVVDYSSVIWGRAIFFAGSAAPGNYDGSILTDLIDSRSPALYVVSTGGHLRVNRIVADGEIPLLAAERASFRFAGEYTDLGGTLGLDSTATTDTMHVVSGADTTLTSADIREIYGSNSVRGDFYAGGDDTYGKILSAAIGQIGTDDPSSFLPNPTITGNGWSSQTIRFIGGDHSGFLTHYP